MSSARAKFLKVQPVVKKIQGIIEKTLESAITQGKFKVKVTDRDQPIEMVKVLTQDTNNFLEATILGARDNATAIPQPCDKITAKIQNQKELSRHKRLQEVWRKKKSSMIAALEAEALKHRELQKPQDIEHHLKNDEIPLQAMKKSVTTKNVTTSISITDKLRSPALAREDYRIRYHCAPSATTKIQPPSNPEHMAPRTSSNTEAETV
jgi:hypothetical protein